ncbi:MAG: hypothetical protein AABN95_10255 [Acidobacteriota bacterium]
MQQMKGKEDTIHETTPQTLTIRVISGGFVDRFKLIKDLAHKTRTSILASPSLPQNTDLYQFHILVAASLCTLSERAAPTHAR